jgi:hypothetical protein
MDRRQSVRVSDAERDHVVEVLREHLVAGRLTTEEFSERIDLALRARIARDLVRVQEDLPRVAAAGPVETSPVRLAAGVFGRVVRRGQLRLRRHTTVVSTFADVDFDLRSAQIDSSKTKVNVLVFFGNVDVYLPDTVHTDARGIAFFGHRRDWGFEHATPDAPAVRVRVIGMFATVDVWRVPEGTAGGYSAVVRKVKKLQLKGAQPN